MQMHDVALWLKFFKLLTDCGVQSELKTTVSCDSCALDWIAIIISAAFSVKLTSTSTKDAEEESACRIWKYVFQYFEVSQ